MKTRQYRCPECEEMMPSKESNLLIRQHFKDGFIFEINKVSTMCVNGHWNIVEVVND